MKLHSARVPQMAAEMLDAIVKAKDIETDSPAEVRADIEAVLNQYIRDEVSVNEKTCRRSAGSHNAS